MNQLATQPAFEFVLSILSGKDKGAVYKMLSPRIRIGRADDNDICLTKDSKISRYHASLTVGPQGVEIRDISDKNKVLVDGVEQTQAIILPGSVIQLGETKIKFDIDHPKNELAERNQNLGLAGQARKKRKTKGKANNGKLRFYIILGVVLLGLAFLLNSEVKSGKEAAELKTVDASKNQIEKNRETVREIQSLKRKKGLDTDEYEQAEILYIQGFRDFQKGQYERAVSSFQSCLAIFPAHERCNNYFRVAQNKLSELIQYYLNLGYDYQTKNQFKACVSAFNNVMFLEKDRTSVIYKEAHAGRDACSEALK